MAGHAAGGIATGSALEAETVTVGELLAQAAEPPTDTVTTYSRSRCRSSG
ncbi:hypothetical protein ACPZ13_00470 [Streptomyces sp. IPPR8]|nr:hypothetical protein [Streptomyces sp. AN-3]MDI3101891.1 hypothetical protein [Streptomyces sp. AN-3]